MAKQAEPGSLELFAYAPVAQQRERKLNLNHVEKMNFEPQFCWQCHDSFVRSTIWLMALPRIFLRKVFCDHSICSGHPICLAVLYHILPLIPFLNKT